MRFVITGAGGFLGANVVRELLTRTDHDVVAVSSQTAGALSAKVGPAFRKMSVVDLDEVLGDGALHAGDVVIHCAFPWNRGGIAMATGLEFATRLYQQATTASVRTFINVSSQSVYSQDRTTPADEESVIECDTPYSTAKYALELAAEAILPRGTLVNARMSSLIGPGYDIRIVNRFIRQILQNAPIVIRGGGQVFDYMDVADAAQALILIGSHGSKSAGSTVNVGASNPLTLEEIATQVAATVEDATGLQAAIRREPSQGDVRLLTLQCERLRNDYGFAPEVSFPESVRRILADIRSSDVETDQLV